MDANFLKYFYRDDGKHKVFLKDFFVTELRNSIIDPNTRHFLAYGFPFITNEDVETSVPCDDAHWCEYMTIKEGLELRSA